jgi:hypothetical protein
MHMLLLLLNIAPGTARADDLIALTDDLDEELDWEDDGTRPDSDARDPDADPTWDASDGIVPEDLGEDPIMEGMTTGSTAPALDEDPDWDTESPADIGLGEDEPRQAPGARSVVPSASGCTPLADNYPLEIARAGLDTIVVELPVLVSQRRSEVSGEFWLIGEVYLDGRRISESRSLVTAAATPEDSPGFVWIKAQAPIIESDGTVEVRLTRQEVGGASRALFTRKASY